MVYLGRSTSSISFMLPNLRSSRPCYEKYLTYLFRQLVFVLYGAGLFFLRRQFKQEQTRITKQDPATSSQMSQRS